MSYSFQIPRDEHIRGRWCGNGDHKAGGSRLEKSEEKMQWSTVEQEDASETAGEGLQNSDPPSIAMWCMFRYFYSVTLTYGHPPQCYQQIIRICHVFFMIG